jgi:hypothetical protein
MPQRPIARGTVGAVGLVAALLVGCGQTGEATTRIDEAEQEIEELTDEIIDLIELEVAVEQPLGRRDRCELVTGQPGAVNRLSARGPIPDVDDPLGRAAAVLSRNGYELIDGERPDEVFGRRDGIRITVAIDPPTGQISVDASTACRALPR